MPDKKLCVRDYMVSSLNKQIIIILNLVYILHKHASELMFIPS